MDLTKIEGFFTPSKIRSRVHIIGCGSVGSTIAENLARFGVKDFVLYDFDTVDSHNIVNQMFVMSDMGKMKVDAVKRIITDINPEAESTIVTHPEGYTGQRLDGYVFLAVDNIDLRREICVNNKLNPAIKAVFDVRTGLDTAQHYAADWSKAASRDNLIESMNFTHEEAEAETPMSACHVPLCAATTVRVVSAYAVNNFVNFVNGKPLCRVLVADIFKFDVEAYFEK